MKLKNPLEETFNIGPSSPDESQGLDLVPVTEQYLAVPEEQVKPPQVDDEEDKEINNKIEEIYNSAMEAYQNQTAFVEILEPRYAARNAEVAANYLNTALNAVSLKARVKNEKRKASSAFIPYNHGGGNTNIVVADRNQILRMMDKNGNDIIDN